MTNAFFMHEPFVDVLGTLLTVRPRTHFSFVYGKTRKIGASISVGTFSIPVICDAVLYQ